MQCEFPPVMFSCAFQALKYIALQTISGLQIFLRLINWNIKYQVPSIQIYIQITQIWSVEFRSRQVR